MTNHISNLLDIIAEYNPTTVRNTLITLICIDIFGIYWYLGWKQVGVGIMVLLMILFTAVIIAARRKDDEMDEKKKEKIRKLEKELKDLKGEDEDEESEEKEEKKEKKDSGMDFGLPSAEEYNKNMEKAFGSGF